MDQFDDLYKVRIAALLRVMYATKYVKDDNVPAQIEEGLYLGSVGAANNKSLLKSLNVTHILTAANSLPPAYPNDFTYKIVDVSDREDVNIAQFFDECFSFINEAKRMGGVLVHCFVGRSRSVTIVVAYLMKKHGMSLLEALNLVKSKRSVAAPNSGFMLQLQNYEKSLQVSKEVFVKVISISGQNLSLSMRDVDQNSGRDLLPLKKSGDDDSLRTNPSSGSNNAMSTSRLGLSGIRIPDEDVGVPSRRPLKRMSSPERWEVKQLMASGVLSVKEYPMFDEETTDGMLYQEEGGDEELEVELNEDEPAFLQGQSHYSMDMSPVKIFKNPEGSLSRASALQSALIKERREVRDQQQRTMLDSIPKDLNRPWEDPMPETGERHLAQELRGVGCLHTICLNGRKMLLVKR
ncbi:hypothetical protein L6452_22393 [Arctium lappa]|uniref:Uncharacterized protein n=1 Tax=Arctium lappa TaxID=4217 RepID=A0ACB9B0A9_ARCLA|nr:hypothetical protein L6452_22393 [Arctium lappa]